MPLTASVSLTVPALPDDDVAFLNAQAWNNYWSNVQGEVAFTPIATTVYARSVYNDALAPININIDGEDNIIPTLAMFTSLLNAFKALELSYLDLRQQMYDAGFIDHV